MGADESESEQMRRRNSSGNCFEFAQRSAVRDCEKSLLGRGKRFLREIVDDSLKFFGSH